MNTTKSSKAMQKKSDSDSDSDSDPKITSVKKRLRSKSDSEINKLPQTINSNKSRKLSVSNVESLYDEKCDLNSSQDSDSSLNSNECSDFILRGEINNQGKGARKMYRNGDNFTTDTFKLVGDTAYAKNDY